MDLYPQKTVKAFARLSGMDEKQILSYAEHDVFKLYEKGEIESAAFRTTLRKLFKLKISDDLIDAAWNAMIGDTPIHRLDWLTVLNKKYRVFILSNTNHIHINFVHNYLSNHHAINDFSNYVEKAYYSQLIGMRKPDEEIFNYVAQQNGLNPSETIFLDDNEQNLMGASTVGIQVQQVIHPEDVPQLLRHAGIEI